MALFSLEKRRLRKDGMAAHNHEQCFCKEENIDRKRINEKKLQQGTSDIIAKGNFPLIDWLTA